MLSTLALLLGCGESQTAAHPSLNGPRTPARSERARGAPSETTRVAARTETGPASQPLRATAVHSGNTVSLPYCLVSLIYEARVPAEEAGVLTEVLVREGDQVSPHDLMAKIDDKQARMALDVAKFNLAVAKEEAENVIRIRYAEAAEKVAYAEYLQSKEANDRFPGTVPLAERRRLLLTHRRAELEIEQAEIDQRIAKKKLQVKEAELAAADEQLERRLIKAPMMGRPMLDKDGKVVVNEKGDPEPRDNEKAEVVELTLHSGEWVQPGDQVLHVVRMDRLRIEGFLKTGETSPGSVIDQPVTVTVELAGGHKEQFRGKVVFVSPLVQAGGDYQVWAEVDNRKEGSGLWLLRPGLKAEMTIEMK